MATFGEILRWLLFTLGRAYYRVAARVMRRDRLLSGSERKFKALLECAPDAMILVNHRGHIALINAQAEALFGYTREELVGQSVVTLIPEGARARHRQHQKGYMKDAATRVMGRDLELRGRRKDGSEFPIEISLSPLETDQGLLVMSAIRDVTERQRTEARLRHLAEHDVLTDLLNRRSFEAHFSREIAVANRHGVEGALILLDVDNLKDVNDTEGHACGDLLLRRLAATLRSRLRQTDIVARLGGDEFAVLLPHTGTTQTRALCAELLRSIREDVLGVEGRRVRISCSAGVATFGQDTSPEEVMLAADLALYDAKEGGRDRLVVHAPKAVEVAARQMRASWTQRLRHTLDGGHLVPYRQPILHTGRQAITQYELLVRVHDAGGRPIPPAAFLPTAERTGMIVEVDRFMIECAVDLIAASVTVPGEDPLSYAVNLSARSLADPGLPAIIAAKLDRSGVDPGLLVFEITETAAIADMEAAREFTTALHDHGCAFALDDFGTGFASFFHLKHLPLDTLKIDGDFIRQIVGSPTDQVIVRHMADLGRSLGLQVTAECVEDQQTLDLVTGYGVSHVQGFHIGRPAPVADPTPVIIRRTRSALRDPA